MRSSEFLGGSVRAKTRTEITIETDRILVMSKRRISVLAWCADCGSRTRMVGVDEAARLAGVSSRTIYRWVEADRLHFAETDEGSLLVCSNSLLKGE